MKKLVCALLMSVLVLSMTGCSTATNGGSDTDIYAEDGYAEGRFGDVMHTYFFDYTVNSAYTCQDFNGYTPAEGNTLLVADVTVKNTFSESIEMYDTDFQVQWGDDNNDDAYDFPITYYTDAVSDEQLPGIYSLDVNESKTGLLVFEVPAGNTDFSISYLELFVDEDNYESEGDTFFVFFTATEKTAE